jgi:deoxyribonuclease IV
LPRSGAGHPPIGSHVRVSTGLARGGLAYADIVGAEAVQVFVSNPRGWGMTDGDSDQDAAFVAGCDRRGIRAFVHTPYLVNLASPSVETVDRSDAAIRHALRRARVIGAEGVVVHTGSSVDEPADVGLRQVRERLLPILDGLLDDDPAVLLEPTAGAGQSLCSSVDDLEVYLAALDHHGRVGICLDTCHAFAAGHDVAAPGGMTALLDQLVATVGGERLKLVHANDSKDALGSRRDRHERIGDGTIGAAAFADLVNHPAVRRVPIVLETPGEAPDHATEVTLLRGFRRA